MANENGEMVLPTVLIHYGSFEPLWQQPGLIQAGPHMEEGPTAIQLRPVSIPALVSKLSSRHWNGRGVLLHYTDPFIIRAMQLKGISHWPGPKILACGDLHHGPQPIETLTAYQEAERHDSVLLTFNPHLLPQVRNAMKVPVRCLAPTFFRYPSAKRSTQPKLQLLHVGSIGPNHPKRRDVVQTLLRQKTIPFYHTTTNNAEEAAQLYAQYAIVLNSPLNQDLNHRCFEIMAAETPQIIFGNRNLIGDLQYLRNRPDLLWTQSIKELERLVEYLFANQQKLANIKVAPAPYWDFQNLIKHALMP